VRLPVTRRVLLWTSVVVALIGIVGSLRSGQLPGNGANWSLGVVAVGYALLGWMVTGRRPQLPIGWLLLAGGLASAAAFTASWWATQALLGDPGSLPGGRVAAWAAVWLDATPPPLVLIAPLVLFPTGRPRSPRWRWFLVTIGAVLTALIAVSLVAAVPAAIGSGPASLLDVPGVDEQGWGGAAVGSAAAARLLALLAALAGFVGIAWSRRRARGDERSAYTTVLVGAAAVGLVFVAGALVGPVTAQQQKAPEELYSASLLCVPAAIAVAIARYRVYDLRAAVSRSVLVAGVGATLAVLYLAVLGVLAAVAGQSGLFSVPSVVAAGAVAVASAPLAATGRRVTRGWFGRPTEAGMVAARFSGHVRDETDAAEALHVLADVMREELRLGSVALAVHGLPTCLVGEADAPRTVVPLEYAGANIGEIAVTPRRGESLAQSDVRLLDDIARYIAVAGQAIRASDDLRRAQHALESAHAEERRRVRRDLHDGVAPTLASIRLKLTAYRRRTGDHGLDDVIDQVADTVREIRRVVEGLQPSVLEDLGLLPALQILVADNRHATGINIVLNAPYNGFDLPPDAANTAYRVISEALANVIRHSHASACSISVGHHDGALDVEIRDNGDGFDTANGHGGMGLRNIVARAAIADGTATITSIPGGGTTVSLRVPT